MIMKSYSLNSILLAILGSILSLIVAEIPCALVDKIIISMVFVILGYVYLFRRIIATRDYISIYTILLLLSVAFYYGQHFVAMINPSYLLSTHEFSILDKRIPDRYIIYATFLCIDCLLIMYAGYSTVPRNELHVQEIDNCRLRTFRFVGWVFFLLSILPAFRLIVAEYQMTVMNGYLGRRILESEDNYLQLLGVSYIELLVAQLFIPSIYTLIIAYKGKKYNMLFYCVLLVYCALYLMTGSRFTILKILVCVVFINYIWVKSPATRDYKRLLIYGCAVAALFTIGSIVRTIGVDIVSGADISSGFKIYDTFWESGITFTTISNMLYQCPDYVDYFYGKSYIGALLQCIPGSSGFDFFVHNNMHISATFSPLYYGQGSMAGYGSSFIAEAYYNFGYLVYIPIYFGGRLFAKAQNSMVIAQNTSNPIKFLITVSLCGELAYAVRNDLVNIPRILLYSVGIIVFVASLFNRLKQK